jgi:cytochrome c-type biogenesis protein CcmH
MIGLLVAFVVAAQQPAPGGTVVVDSALEANTRAVAAQLRCPVCQGLSIQDSPSPLAQEMKGVVREQLRAGRTPEQVKAYFVSKYGEWILLEPEPRGFNLAVYLLPLVMLVAGAILIFFLARKWSRSGTATAKVPEEEELEPELR